MRQKKKIKSELQLAHDRSIRTHLPRLGCQQVSKAKINQEMLPMLQAVDPLG